MPDRGSRDRLSPAELRAWQGFLRVGARLERLLDADLERAHGLSGSDYVVLTPAGRTRLRAANRTHLERVRELFLERLSDVQLGQLAEIWETLEPGAPPEGSGPQDGERPA